MSSASFRHKVEQLLEHADVTVDGSRPWDLQVKHPHFFKRVLAQGSLGFGESYMDGWWESKSPDQLLTRLISAKLDQKVKTTVVAYDALKAKLLNRQTSRRAFQVGEKHYNVGNDL